MTRQRVTVSEIFGPVIQGEGHLAGRPTVFVRTGGCDFACIWCDSMHAVDAGRFGGEWEDVGTDELIERVERLTGGNPLLVTLSGGNPALQPLGPLVEEGHARGYTFALETQGSVSREWFAALDHLVLSPKGPSSGMAQADDFVTRRLDKCLALSRGGPTTVFKVVVFGEEDYQFARRLWRHYGGDFPFFLQAGTPQVVRLAGVPEGELAQVTASDVRSAIAGNTRWLIERVKRDRWFDVRVSFQQHAMIWGEKRGV